MSKHETYETIDETTMAAQMEVTTSQLRHLIAQGMAYHAHPSATARGYLFHKSAISYACAFADCVMTRGGHEKFD